MNTVPSYNNNNNDDNSFQDWMIMNQFILPTYYQEQQTKVVKQETKDIKQKKREQSLEKNRQAALKCRQKKKIWLEDLQQHVEFLSHDNEQLHNEANHLREQVLDLKTLLLAHVDCPVAQSNGTTANTIQSTFKYHTH